MLLQDFFCIFAKTALMYFVGNKIIETSEIDIEAYKVIRNVGFWKPKHTGPYMTNHEFCDLNGTYFTQDFFNEPSFLNGKYVSTGGFHSFKNLQDAVKEMDFLEEYVITGKDESLEIVPCIIPAKTSFSTGYEEGGIPVYCSCTLKLNY